MEMIEFIKSIFGRVQLGKVESKPINTKSNENTNIPVSELLKKATSLKKTNIEESILLIKQAIKISSDFSSYDKLINYLMIANKMEEAETVILKLISESKKNDNLFNYSIRKGNYEQYTVYLFKQNDYKNYLFYYCLSIFNNIVWCALFDDIKSVKYQLEVLKNKEEFTDKKTNKSFSEIGVSANQDLFIITFYEILNDFHFDKLYKLVHYLLNDQKDIEKLQIESFDNGKEDWLLWSNQEFRELIKLYDETIFIEKYKAKLEILLG